MDLKEIVNRSQSNRHHYPDIFQDDCGLDIKIQDRGGLHAIPSWGRTKNNQIRCATLEISTFRGISGGAIHYYGNIYVQGVNMEYDTNPGTTTMCGDWEDKYPLSKYRYQLTLTRPITQEEIDLDKELGEYLARFPYQDVGDQTICWESIEQIIEFAKEVFKARFSGKWEFYVTYTWKSDKEKIEI